MINKLKDLEPGRQKVEDRVWWELGAGLFPNSWVLFVLVAILHFPTSIIQAQTLDEHLLTAAENNPEIQAYFSDYLAALERVPQAGTLPDPELSLGLFVRPMERFMGNQHADLQLMQMFPWFGSLGIRKDEASKMARARYEAFRMVKNELLFQVKVAWYELSRLNEEIKISKAHLNILEKYERLALVRYQSSSTEMNRSNSSSNQGMEDVLRIRMEMNELENTISLLKDTQEALVAEFNALLNRDPEETLAIPDKLSDEPLPMNRLELLDSIKTFNPGLRMLEAEGAAYAVQKKMAELEGRPMMGAGINYMAFSPRMENGMNMGGNNMVMPMFKITLPIYRKKFKSIEKAAELNQQASLQRKENTVNQLSSQWRNALRDWDDANRRVGLYQQQTKLAQQTLDLLMTAYANDGKAFEDLLKVQQQLLDYQLKHIMAIVDKHNSVAQLENLAGF
ncbi:TolC family protein [Cyclobacterium sp.]|uniref:TolC family protein n=1 Tax=Cyclobacterium sp. TaxID=1966343 RepID=UPI0019B3A81F|nr:TolC family protein [Cyclobacterium sp.]MBD3626526.1 TolC family protein [Cyclobacterium sp.]